MRGNDRARTSKQAKILAIAVESSARAQLLEWLESGSYNAIAAETASSGLQLAQTQRPDLILCEARLPDADCWEVLRALKKDSQAAIVPFIVLGSSSETVDLQQIIEAGGDNCLNAPLEAEKTLKALETQLQKHQAIRQYYAQRLERQLERDRLTQLPDRQTLNERFVEFLERYGLNISERSNGAIVPVLCFSLDRFYRIYDHFGYAWGDRLLQAAARRLAQAVGERGVVASSNAHEFALLLPPVAHKREVLDTVERIREPFSKPFHLDRQEVFLSASIGISLYPRDGRSLDKLLHRATRAMNTARTRGGNCVELYTALLNIDRSNPIGLESELRRAWQRQELEVYYQPKVELKTGQIVSCEALLRWQHPQRGWIAPDKFLPAAEEMGLMGEIGEWVLKTGGKQLYQWHQAGWKHLCLAVNISARQFNQIDMRQRIAKILAEIPLNYQSIELEFLESSLLQNAAISAQRLNAFKALGMTLAIDDFGTGYSSLNYLRQFPFNVVKIDPCFIQNLVDNYANQAIISAIIQMAHALGIKVVAEGVETEAELDFLCAHHCDEIQGYIFSQPLSAARFTELLQSDKKLIMSHEG
ncbi:GGDEF domain-containing response regulator [Oscillatoria sp. FACHB-1406]|uniref:putative bifunctional diguanylate cyclase/phosphodiesterase n=1 Tax=Oscillatoria sp. FACHB-1406 TaxID=2692846 RepID=UPI0016846621|nr:GGDEF domain-containing response regulator [Oscillatoria sp. FACHB-1406]MBD2578224.1 GGDEF domain-containing response regulator [Oscillatoria sp. FACHB-1406]